MNKLKVTIKQTEVTIFDSGDLPIGLVRALLEAQNDGTFDGNWALHDLRSTTDFIVDSIEVEEVK